MSQQPQPFSLSLVAALIIQTPVGGSSDSCSIGIAGDKSLEEIELVIRQFSGKYKTTQTKFSGAVQKAPTWQTFLFSLGYFHLP